MIHLLRRTNSDSGTGRAKEHSEQSGRRRGNVLVLAALLLVFVFAMVAFAIDIGYIVHVDTEFQRTADACALAAATLMPDLNSARDRAKEVALENAHVEGPALKSSDIVFGHWDRRTATWYANHSDVNGVQVIVRRTAATGNPLELFFAKAMGQNVTDIQAEAIAMFDNQLCGPLVGIEWVDIPGNPTTDSYWSEDGPYWAQTPGDNGDVCSDGPIAIDGGAIINGDANPGRGYQTTITGNSIVTGNTKPRIRPLNMPPVDDSQVALINDNALLPPIQKGNSLVPMPDANGDFLLDGGRVYDMPPGTYYFRDFYLTGQSEIHITGDTDIYIYGNMDTSGGRTLNDSQVPQNMQIWMTGGTAIVTASSTFYGSVYAPNTEVTLTGSAPWYGAFVGRTLTVTGTGDIHYDENLEFEGEIPLPNRTGLVR